MKIDEFLIYTLLISFQVRPIQYDDFLQSLTQIRPSVVMDTVKNLEEWNQLYGIGQKQ